METEIVYLVAIDGDMSAHYVIKLVINKNIAKSSKFLKAQGFSPWQIDRITSLS